MKEKGAVNHYIQFHRETKNKWKHSNPVLPAFLTSDLARRGQYLLHSSQKYPKRIFTVISKGDYIVNSGYRNVYNTCFFSCIIWVSLNFVPCATVSSSESCGEIWVSADKFPFQHWHYLKGLSATAIFLLVFLHLSTASLQGEQKGRHSSLLPGDSDRTRGKSMELQLSEQCQMRARKRFFAEVLVESQTGYPGLWPQHQTCWSSGRT